MASDKLWIAISQNNLKEIHKILSTGDIDLNKPHSGPRNFQTKGTFLQQACVSGSPMVACALVKAGANVNACSIYKGHYYEFSATALILAVIQRKVDLVEKLIHRCGADVNVTNDEGLAPLHFITEMIFSRGPLEKYGSGIFNDRRFHHSTSGQNPEEVMDKKIANLLLTAGATVDLKTKDGQTPLHFASMESEKGSVAVDILLQHGARANIQDGNGMTPLHNAVKAQNVVTVQRLLQHGATTNIQNREGMTPLHFAVEQKAHATVQLLLQHGAKADIQNSEGMTLLHFAAAAKDVTTAKILLEHGAKVDIQNSEGMTPLHLAADTRSSYMYMFQSRADSSKSNILATAQILLQYHARADIRNNMGLTALHISIHEHHYELCKLLIQESGPNSSAVVNLAENDGTTPLHAVIERGKYHDEAVTVVKLLIEKGANLEATKDHLTPLHLAADGRLLNVVKLLVEAGADIHAETPHTGLTPLDMAEHGGNQDIIDYLTASQKIHGKKN